MDQLNKFRMMSGIPVKENRVISDVNSKPKTIEITTVDNDEECPSMCDNHGVESVGEAIAVCPICGAKMNKADYYDHMAKNHPETLEQNNSDEQNGSDNYPDPNDAEINFQIQDGRMGHAGMTDVAMGMSAESEENEEMPVEEAEGVLPLVSAGKGAVEANVWDMKDDRDESPNPYPKEDDPITVPKEITDLLAKEIKELKAETDKLVHRDYLTAEFMFDCAVAMEEILKFLELKNLYGIKMAQVHMVKLMSPIIQKIPDKVHDFVMRGGEVETISSLFKKVKSQK